MNPANRGLPDRKVLPENPGQRVHRAWLARLDRKGQRVRTVMMDWQGLPGLKDLPEIAGQSDRRA